MSSWSRDKQQQQQVGGGMGSWKPKFKSIKGKFDKLDFVQLKQL